MLAFVTGSLGLLSLDILIASDRNNARKANGKCQVPDSVSDLKLIRHVVFFSCKDQRDVDRVVQGLKMLGDIPQVRNFEVSRNRQDDRFSNVVDVVVYAEFESNADLDAYRRHPIYEDCIKIVRPLRDLRIAADF